jgi:pimeloyl-ACP methyl ester carboxylesterase
VARSHRGRARAGRHKNLRYLAEDGSAVAWEVVNQEPPVRYRTIHGHRRAYRLLGEGPPLLLLHGIGDSSASWLPVMAELAQHHTVIAPDLLGHGNSAKPRADYSVAAYANGMRDLLEVLGVERATVVGHSLGGGVAAQFAYQYPERCERLILVATGGVARAVNPFLRVASAPLAEVLLVTMNLPPMRPFGRLGLEFLRQVGHDMGRDKDELTEVFSRLPDTEARVAFTRTLRSAVDWRGQVVTMRDRAYLTAHMPTLIMWGTNDGIIPSRHAQIIHEAMPGSLLEYFPGAGHFPHHSDPQRFIDLILTFINTTPPADHNPEVWRAALRDGRPGVSTTEDDAIPELRTERPGRTRA